MQVLCKSWSLFCIFDKTLIIATFIEIIWADVWHCGEEVALASDR